MNNECNVLVYGVSGYIGKLIVESFVQCNMFFYFVGCIWLKFEVVLKIVEQCYGVLVDGEIVVVSNMVEEFLFIFDKVDVVINVVGFFMQVVWLVVEVCLEFGCYYIDIIGE